MAHNGTLFLDEIADLPMALQVKLLRVLQEREVQRLGGHKTLKLNLRIVAATNRDLRQAVAAGQFREDLYFRLSAVNIHVPALRHRPTDIPILASYFLQRAATTHQTEIAGFASDAMSVLQNYHWPGNIRELQHLIERATLLCTGDRIRAEHLGDLATTTVVPSRQSLHARMNVEKRRRVESALAQSGGNQAAAARSLGMSRSNLGRLMKSLGLKEPGGLQ
jgi:transcriptional regulator with GAF, ATPase, and Fis domain